MRVTSFALIALCLLPLGTGFGQQSEAGAAGLTRSALLGPKGFTYEGECADGRVFSGGPIVFKEQGDKVAANITFSGGTCEVLVEVAGDKVQYTGCTGALIWLVHRPSNAYEPFKGKWGDRWCDYILKPR